MRRAIAVALVVASTGLVTGAQTPSQAPPIFRGEADLVSVDVSVHSGGNAVSGLSPADFELRDNGVVQRVEMVDRSAMPLDVTILVDVSGHTHGVWDYEVPADKTASVLKEDVAAIARILRPQDRLRLLTTDTYIKQVFAMGPPERGESIEAVPMHGLPAIYDALVTTMLRRPEAGRRQLIVAWVKALDFMSGVDAVAVRDVAQHTEAVVHVIERDLVVSLVRIPRIPRESYFRTWRPHVSQDLTILPGIVSETGGTLHGFGVLTDSGIADAFKEIFDDFRGGYVLRYAPQGVTREGWHDLVVRVPGRPDLTVRARRGYAVEGPRRAATSRPAAPNTRVATLDEIADTFGKGDRRAFNNVWRRVPDARQLLRDYVARSPIWPASPRREAAFVLSLVEAPLLGSDVRARDEALDLLRRQHDFVRDPLGARDFECQWYRTEMALMQAAPRPDEALATIKHALTRCPDDPRLTLGLAVASDAQWLRIAGTRPAGRQAEPDLFTLFDAAARFPQTAGEAGVRSAFLAYREGRLDEAERRLATTEAQPADGFVRYLSHLTRARVFQKQGRIDDAISQFHAALVAWPGAHSARVGLMAALMIRGDRREASTLSEGLQTSPSDQFDPFEWYWLGDYRAIEGLQARLRELAR